MRVPGAASRLVDLRLPLQADGAQVMSFPEALSASCVPQAGTAHHCAEWVRRSPKLESDYMPGWVRHSGRGFSFRRADMFLCWIGVSVRQ